jgi:hypothetical protein
MPRLKNGKSRAAAKSSRGTKSVTRKGGVTTTTKKRGNKTVVTKKGKNVNLKQVTKGSKQKIKGTVSTKNTTYSVNSKGRVASKKRRSTY